MYNENPVPSIIIIIKKCRFIIAIIIIITYGLSIAQLL